jgi:hypothetical protein
MYSSSKLVISCYLLILFCVHFFGSARIGPRGLTHAEWALYHWAIILALFKCFLSIVFCCKFPRFIHLIEYSNFVWERKCLIANLSLSLSLSLSLIHTHTHTHTHRGTQKHRRDSGDREQGGEGVCVRKRERERERDRETERQREREYELTKCQALLYFWKYLRSTLLQQVNERLNSKLDKPEIRLTTY